MHVSTRSYLTAGLSVVAAGAIIATPVSRPAPQQEPSNPLVRNQQVQLAAMASPITIHSPANSPQAVHAVAEVARAFQNAKAANVASTAGATSASPTVARPKVAQPPAATPSQASSAQTGAVTTQDPATADTPGSDGGQSSTVSGPVSNAIDPSGVGTVLADTAQLAIDTVIGVPAQVIADTAFDVDTFALDLAAGNPDAFSNFFMNVSNDFQGDVGIISDDFQALQDSIGNLFGVDTGDDSATTVAAAKTAANTATKAGASDTDPASGAVDGTTAKKHQRRGLDTGSKGDVTGKGSQDVSAKPAKAKTPGQKGDTAPAKQSGTETKDPSNSKSTESVSDTGSQASKGDTTKQSGDQSTSTSTNNEHRNAPSSVAAKDNGATKTNKSTHTPSRTSSHAASAGAKHSGVSGAKGGNNGNGGGKGRHRK
jgi:hypothetical protein